MTNSRYRFTLQAISAFEVVFADAGCAAGVQGVCTVKVGAEEMKLSPNDTTVDIRVFIDNVLVRPSRLALRASFWVCRTRCSHKPRGRAHGEPRVLLLLLFWFRGGGFF